MIKGVIFDLDGTLLNTLPSIAWFGNLALEKNGLQPIEEDKYRYMAGEGAKLLVERMIEENGASQEAYFEKVYHDYRTAYDADTAYKTAYYDGILELLGALQHFHMHMAVFSNKPQPQVDHVISAFFPESLFDVVQGAVEGLPRKPDPTGVFQILEKWNISAEECLYIGDTATDMKTGKAAGCRTIGVSWGFRTIDELLDNGAYAVAEKPMEIMQVL